MKVVGSAFGCRTVLWIGDRESDELRCAYQVAEMCASQLAYRPSLGSAIDRSASDVDLIIVATRDRSRLNAEHLDELNRRHPSAIRYLLRGPLCRGVRLAGDDFFGGRRCDWVDGAATLRNLIGERPRSSSDRKVVAVMASHYTAAQPLLDVAENANCGAVWCRCEGLFALRGVTHAWWDDSLAVPTDAEGWRKRMAAMGATPTNHSIHHTWVTNRVHWMQIQQAQQAGIGSVLTKPFSLEMLLQSIQGDQSLRIIHSDQPSRKPSSAQMRRAA